MSIISTIKSWNHSRLNSLRRKKMLERGARLKSFGGYAEAICVSTPQGDFLVDPQDNFVSRHLLEEGSYGESELNLTREFLTKDSSICVLVGAHIGSLLVPIASQASHVYTFEANPKIYKLLTKNLKLNGVLNVTSTNIALAEFEGEIEFLQSTDNSGGSKRMPMLRTSGYFYDHPETIKIPCGRLDDLIPVQDIDLIFFDIEGSEYFAFQGAQKILSRSKVLITEFIPHHIQNVAGKSVDDFWSLLAPHFDTLEVPKLQLRARGSQEILQTLRDFFHRNQSFDNIVLRRSL